MKQTYLNPIKDLQQNIFLVRPKGYTGVCNSQRW